MRHLYWLLLLLVLGIFASGVDSHFIGHILKWLERLGIGSVILERMDIGSLIIGFIFVYEFHALAQLLFAVLLPTWILSTLLDGRRHALAKGLAITLFVIFPLGHLADNYAIYSRAKSVVTTDHDDRTTPVGDVIAVRGETTHCDEICERALLGGRIRQFLVIRQDADLAIDPGAQAMSFRMEKRDTCPKTTESRYRRRDRNSKDGTPIRRLASPIQIAIADGNCVIEEKVPLGTADVIFSFSTVNRAKPRPRFLPTADIVRPGRIMTLHEKRGDAYVETFRQTSLVFYRLRIFPLFSRSEQYNDPPNWKNFLATRLNL